MAKITIYLSVDEPGKLHLRDSEGHTGEDNITTNVKDNDTLVWTLETEKNPGISAITMVASKNGKNIFSDGPKQKSKTEWFGVVAPKASGEESYYIEYNLEDGTPQKDDPVVVVDPH